MGSSSGSSSKQSNAPWSGQQPFLKDVFGAAQSLYQRDMPRGGVTPWEQQMLNRDAREFGQGGSPYQRALSQYTGQNAWGMGDRFNPYVGQLSNRNEYNPMIGRLARDRTQNPYLDQTFNRAAGRVGEQFNEQVLPGIHSAFSSAGRTGGGLHGQTVTGAAGELGDTLSGLATDIYGGAYDRDMSRQLQGEMAAGNLYGQGMQRRLMGDLGAAQYAGQDLGRNLQNRQFAASQLPILEEMRDQDKAGLRDWAKSDWNNLGRYSSIVQSNPYMASTGRSGSKGIGIN